MKPGPLEGLWDLVPLPETIVEGEDDRLRGRHRPVSNVLTSNLGPRAASEIPAAYEIIREHEGLVRVRLPCREHTERLLAPVAAANRIGNEGSLDFYGNSFICDQRGDVKADLSEDEEGIGLVTFDREALRRYRANWGFFRDRRPELYGRLTGDEPSE